MLGSRFTQTAEHAASRYKLLLAGFAHVFATRRDDADPGLPRTLKRAAAAGYTLAEQFLAQEQEHITTTLQHTGAGAASSIARLLGSNDTAPGDAALAHLDALAADLDTSLRLQLERDVGAILRGLRGLSLRARLVTAESGTPRSDALKTAAAGQPQFAFLDRAGRRWPSPNYVRTLWRHAQVLAWNEVALLTMADHQIGTAEILHPDQAHEWFGVRIALDERPELPSWEEVRDAAFHPNSDAYLSAIP